MTDAGFVAAADALVLPEQGRGAFGTRLVVFLRYRPVSAFAAFVLAVVFACAIGTQWIAPYGERAIVASPLAGASLAHPLGTDDVGRDFLSRIIYGARDAVSSSLLAVFGGTLIGAFIGITSGYFGGWFDTLLQRLVDILQAFPLLILALVIVTMLGRSTLNTGIAVAAGLIAGQARIARSEALRTRSALYVDAAKAVGAGPLRVLRRHILPNVTSTLIVMASLAAGNALLATAALAFLGLGTQPPTASWGLMLNGAGIRFMESNPTLAIYPTLAIALTVLSFHLSGDTLRDLLDPKQRGGLQGSGKKSARLSN